MRRDSRWKDWLLNRHCPKSRFLAFAEEFSVFFFDQFGVLHDGRSPYPGAVEALRTLKARGARIVILSNSGKSGIHNASRMEKIGFGRGLYDHFVTSGDVAKWLLLAGKLPVAVSSTTRCFTVSTSDEHDFANELGLTNVASAADADVLLISGSQANHLSDNLSYSFEVMYPNNAAVNDGFRWTNTLKADFAIAADINPGTLNGSNPVQVTTTSSGKDAQTGNSPNHQKGGQNIMFGDLHVEFLQTCMSGVNQDNIYCNANPRKADGSTDPKGLVDDYKAGPNHKDDSVLYPVISLP